jgi:ATP-binding cassette subfamily C protein CydC
MRRLLLAGALAAGTDLAGIGLVATATWLLVRAAQQPPLAALGVAIVAVRALAIAKGTLRYAERLAGHDAALGILARLRTRVYAALSAEPSRAPRGDLLARLVSDVDGVQDALLRCVLPAGAAALVALAVTGFTAVHEPAAALVLGTGLLLAGLVLPVLSYVFAVRTGRHLAAVRGAFVAASVDLLAGAADLTAFGAMAQAQGKADREARRLARLERATGTAGSAIGAVAALVPGTTAVTICLLSVHSGLSSMVGVLALAALATVEAVVPLTGAAARLAGLRGGLSRVRDLCQTEPGHRPIRVGGERGIEEEQPVPGPVDVVLRGVTVRYAADREPALDGVDLTLPYGRRVAVVGPSGSGKSTLLAVLAGTVAPQRGTVSAAGPAVATGVLSDAYVFHASVRENLTLGRVACRSGARSAFDSRSGVTDADLARALVTAGLPDWADRLDHVVGEDGGLLSGGQRQRLLLARALLDPTPVVLLDEPTEGLDPAAADRVLDAVLEATAGHTVVLVTHRAADLRRFDEVVTLVDGRVVDAARWTLEAMDVAR